LKVEKSTQKTIKSTPPSSLESEEDKENNSRSLIIVQPAETTKDGGYTTAKYRHTREEHLEHVALNEGLSSDAQHFDKLKLMVVN